MLDINANSWNLPDEKSIPTTVSLNYLNLKYQLMNPPDLFSWLIVTLMAFIVGCSAVAGPHRIRVGHHEGLKVIQIEGYGMNALHQKDISALHFGRYRRTLACEESLLGDGIPSDSFAILSQLPDVPALHYSVVDLGFTAAFEPTFYGLSLGNQYRRVSRLPMERSLILETSQHAGDEPSFSLKYPL
jgi:hypothetical protein